MKHSYKEQINAIKEMRSRLSIQPSDDPTPMVLNPYYLRDVLNDAASTIASLNLNPDIFDRVRDLENQLKVMTSICLLTSDPSDKEVKFEIAKSEALLTK